MNVPPLSRIRQKRLARLSAGKVRREDGLQLLEGPKLVEEALKVGAVHEIIARSDVADAWQELAPGLPVHAVDATVLAQIATVQTPQEVLAIGPQLVGESLDAAPLDSISRLLLMDGVQDPGNVGSMARTAYALGLDGLVLGGETPDPSGPKVLRASAGALLRLKLFRADDSKASLDRLVAAGLVPVIPVVRDGVSLRDLAPPKRYVLVAGREGSGARVEHPSALKLTIPMVTGAESLNVGAAIAAILGRWL